MQESFNRRNVLQVIAAGLVSTRSVFAFPVATGPAESGNSDSAGTQLPCSVVFRENARFDPQPFGDLRYYLEGSTGEVRNFVAGYLELNVGQTPHAPHTHPEEEFMIFIEGHGELSLDGKVTAVRPGAVAYASGGCRHGLVNTGTARLMVYYLKWFAK
jgi:quercetin dioxygenase-like cupin family protein